MRRNGKLGFMMAGILAFAIFHSQALRAQHRQDPGQSIGSVSTRGNLIVLTLNENALGKANLFNLANHTLRFTPDGSRYRVETVPLVWDPSSAQR
jgi:hypothetical protein